MNGYCENCPCVACMASRAQRKPLITHTGVSDECAYVRIGREYAARGETVPSSLLLYCGCSKCSSWC